VNPAGDLGRYFPSQRTAWIRKDCAGLPFIEEDRQSMGPDVDVSTTGPCQCGPDKFRPGNGVSDQRARQKVLFEDEQPPVGPPYSERCVGYRAELDEQGEHCSRGESNRRYDPSRLSRRDVPCEDCKPETEGRNRPASDAHQPRQ
jgi:hypothetical protein